MTKEQREQLSELTQQLEEIMRQLDEDDKVKLDQEPKKPYDLMGEVTKLIHQIGIPAHIKGYKYVRTAVIMAIEEPESLDVVTKILYPNIAKKYQSTPSSVERAIRHAIQVAWGRGAPTVIENIFGYTVSADKGKPTNSEFIAMLADFINLERKKYNLNKK